MHSPAVTRRARPVHYRRVRQPARIWLQPQASWWARHRASIIRNAALTVALLAGYLALNLALDVVTAMLP